MVHGSCHWRPGRRCVDCPCRPTCTGGCCRLRTGATRAHGFGVVRASPPHRDPDPQRPDVATRETAVGPTRRRSPKKPAASVAAANGRVCPRHLPVVITCGPTHRSDRPTLPDQRIQVRAPAVLVRGHGEGFRDAEAPCAAQTTHAAMPVAEGEQPKKASVWQEILNNVSARARGTRCTHRAAAPHGAGRQTCPGSTAPAGDSAVESRRPTVVCLRPWHATAPCLIPCTP